MTSLILLNSMIIAKALHKNGKTKKKKIQHKKMHIKKSSKATGVMCRICNQEKGDIPIFDNIVHPNMSEDIQFFSGVTMDKSDSFSKHLCQHCLDLLKGCVMFREICQLTNKKLIEMAIKKESNVEATETCNNYDEYNVTDKQDSDGSYDVPSPTFSEEDLTCPYCNKSYFNLTTLKHHKKRCKSNKSGEDHIPNESKKRFLCDVCGQTTYSNANLLSHMSTHVAVFPYKCEICPYQGRTIDLLKVHQRTHMADKTYKSTHVAVFPYKCEICPYQGRTIDLLKVHQRTHMADKPYKCEHCPKATTTASNLAKHTRQVHSSARPHKCSYCDKGFSYQHIMKRHIRDIHLRQGTSECDICFKKFNTRKILRGHQFKVHKIKGERQGRLPAYLLTQMEQNEHVDEGESEQMF